MTAERTTEVTEVETLRRKITSYLKRYIRENELKENDRLPSENAISERFHVNRNTVRGAMAILKAQGIIYSEKGRGFFVAERPKPVIYHHDNSLGFSEILNNGTRSFTSSLLSLTKRKPTKRDCKKLRIRPEENVYYLEQLRTLGGKKLAVCLSVIPEKYVPDLESHTSGFHGTNHIFVNGYHYPHPECVWVYLEASLPTAREMELLEISDDMPILQQENLFVIQDLGPIEYFRVRARGDMLHFSMEFE